MFVITGASIVWKNVTSFHSRLLQWLIFKVMNDWYNWQHKSWSSRACKLWSRSINIITLVYLWTEVSTDDSDGDNWQHNPWPCAEQPGTHIHRCLKDWEWSLMDCNVHNIFLVNIGETTFWFLSIQIAVASASLSNPFSVVPQKKNITCRSWVTDRIGNNGVTSTSCQQLIVSPLHFKGYLSETISSNYFESHQRCRGHRFQHRRHVWREITILVLFHRIWGGNLSC